MITRRKFFKFLLAIPFIGVVAKALDAEAEREKAVHAEMYALSMDALENLPPARFGELAKELDPKVQELLDVVKARRKEVGRRWGERVMKGFWTGQ